MGLTPLYERYRSLPAVTNTADFARHALETLAIKVRTAGCDPDCLPSSGPLLLASNHPFGAVEGLVLASLFSRARPDLKILVNHMLYRIPELRRLFIPVDVGGGKNARAGNIFGLRDAMRHLEAGGTLAIFPAGAVSYWHARVRCVTDPVWNPLVGRLARVAGTQVAPLYFEGRNSLLFQAAGCLHPALRTMLLPRELWRMRGNDVRLTVSQPLEPTVLSALGDDAGRAAYIRACCYTLGRKAGLAARSVPVAPPGAREALRNEVAALRKHILADEGNFQVFPVRGDAAPRILHEIGRLREETFRAAQEGSGNAVDIDRFDPHYTHLVLWDKDAEAIAGSYRVRIIFPGRAQDSLKKLYTASLFRFQPEFFELCGTSMELGRAFVTREYQREYAPLLMLWKGIARLAVRSGVRTLFGACSIGLGYAPSSIHMLRRCLEENHFAPDLAGFARGRRLPAPFPGPNEPHARGLEYKLLNRAVKNLEGGKGLPILFKQYLQLGGRIAAFHEDAAFGTLDALTIVDLAAIPDKILVRYLSRDHTPGQEVPARQPASAAMETDHACIETAA